MLNRYLPHYKSIIKLGLPILVGQLGMIAVGFADNIMVGQYSTPSLSASSFVVNIFNIAMMFLMGMTLGLTPLIGAMHARDSQGEIGTTVRMGLRLNIITSLAVTIIMGLLYFAIPYMGQPESLLPLIRPYYLLFLAGMVPVVIFNVFAQWSYAITNTVMPTIIVLISNAVNVAGNWLLINGYCGFPELGLMGAGYSTLISRALCALLIVVIFFFHPRFKVYRDAFMHRAPTHLTTRKIFNTSYPIAFQISIETASFSLAAVMTGWLPDGHIALGAFQILLIVGTLGFCIYYSMGAGVSVLVANAAGRGDTQGMRTIGFAGYHVILAIALCSSMLFIFAGRSLISLFSDGDEALISLAAAQIFPLVLYQMADATQINFSNALRGTSHVRPMMWISLVCYIIVGVPATYIMGITMELGLYGIYLSFSVSLVLAAVSYMFFFMRNTASNKKN